jgi:DNA polymerase/3'-5' exonuclease PolX
MRLRICVAEESNMKSIPSNAVEDPAEASVIRRIKTLIESVDLDCGCRAQLNDALDRFASLEHRRMLRQHLIRAQQHRERIEAILGFLQEVDDLVATEPDRSVYKELALLFEEVAVIAKEGASAMDRLAVLSAADAKTA